MLQFNQFLLCVEPLCNIAIFLLFAKYYFCPKSNIKHLISNSTNDSITVKLLFSLSNGYSYNRPESSIYYLNSALPLINKNNLRNERALYYLKMGNALIEQSKLEEGLEKTFFAISIYDSLDNKNGMAKAYNLIGNIYAENTNYEQALDNFSKSLKLYELISDTYNIIVIVQATIAEKNKFVKKKLFLIDNIRCSSHIATEYDDIKNLSISDIIERYNVHTDTKKYNI